MTFAELLVSVETGTLDKPVVKLVGMDGNAFSIMGRVSKACRKARWSKDDVDALISEMTSGDYNHLLRTVMQVCNDVSADEDLCYECGRPIDIGEELCWNCFGDEEDD